MNRTIKICCALVGLSSLVRAEMPVAKVGDAEVSPEAVRRIASRNGYNLYDQTAKSNAVNEAVAFELLAAKAEELGYFDDPDIARVVKRMAVQKLVANEVDAKMTPELLTEEQYRAYYDENIKEFSKPSLVRGRVLKVLKRDGAQARFDEAVKALEAGEAFAAVVKQFADDASARANGGMSGWLSEARNSRRYPKAVVDALFGLTEKEAISEPVETDKALFLVQLFERRDGNVMPYEKAKRNIAHKLKMKLRKEAYSAYVESLKGDISIEIDETALEQLVEPENLGDGPPSGPVPATPKENYNK